MRLLICIDDTDNLDSPGTGEILENIGKGIVQHGWGKTGFITRHQLFIHEDIEYTSHNSSMCFLVETEQKNCEKIVAFAQEYLLENSAAGSDPGLCVVELEKISSEEVKQLMEFGVQAKQEVLTKAEAYALARKIDGVHLSEHGGTGDGIIGAIAGCGLRLSGNDGRIKGKIKVENPGEITTVKEMKRRYGVEVMMVIPEMMEPGDNEKVLIGNELKSIYYNSKLTMPICLNEDPKTREQVKLKTCNKKHVKVF